MQEYVEYILQEELRIIPTKRIVNEIIGLLKDAPIDVTKYEPTKDYRCTRCRRPPSLGTRKQVSTLKWRSRTLKLGKYVIWWEFVVCNRKTKGVPCDNRYCYLNYVVGRIAHGYYWGV